MPAHPRILKRCTGLALRLSGNAHTHHSSLVASCITHLPFVVCLPSLPHARPLCSSARPAVVVGRRCVAWRVAAAAALSARSPPAALLPHCQPRTRPSPAPTLPPSLARLLPSCRPRCRHHSAPRAVARSRHSSRRLRPPAPTRCRHRRRSHRRHRHRLREALGRRRWWTR